VKSRLLLFFSSCSSTCSPPTTSSTSSHRRRRLRRHRQARYKVNCNAAIIVLGDSVLVVDTHSNLPRPRAHRANQKTHSQAVKFVVNTHFIGHYQGNEAIPVLARRRRDISSEATRRTFSARHSAHQKRIVTMPQEIAT